MAESMIGTAISSYTFLVVSLLWKTRSKKQNTFKLNQTNWLYFHSELVVAQRNKIVRIWYDRIFKVQYFLQLIGPMKILSLGKMCWSSHRKNTYYYPICFQEAVGHGGWIWIWGSGIKTANPDSATYRLCDFGQVVDVSMPQFPNL